MSTIAERNHRRTTPFRYLAAMAALMVASAWVAVVDKSRRGVEEIVVLPTALGDKAWHPSGVDRLAPESLGLPLAHFRGKPLYPQGRVAREMRADAMTRVGTTDSGAFGVFAPADKPVDPATGYLLLVGVRPENPQRGLFREVGENRRYHNSGNSSPEEEEAPPPAATP
jgi:hypothetical protein